MSSIRPAWSWKFSGQAIPRLDPTAGLDDLTQEWAWGGSTGAGVRVAVIDSGIDATHPGVGPVQGYVAVGESEEGPTFDPAPHDDAYGHGTACAGIIRALAPDCELYSVKVLGPALSGSGRVFAAGLRWALDHGMRVCNLSLGTTKRDFFGVLHELADDAYFRGTLLVTAANNVPIPSFPSVFASVVSVASHDVKDPSVFYYSPGSPVEFGALGIDVRVPWQDGQWITATGNSFAAPHITGMVARILGKHPELTPFQVKTVLRALASNVAADPDHACQPVATEAERP